MPSERSVQVLIEFADADWFFPDPDGRVMLENIRIVLKSADQVDAEQRILRGDEFRFLPSQSVRQVIVQKKNIGFDLFQGVHPVFQGMGNENFEIFLNQVVFD